jgi:hypothetical protein
MLGVSTNDTDRLRCRLEQQVIYGGLVLQRNRRNGWRYLRKISATSNIGRMRRLLSRGLE